MKSIVSVTWINRTQDLNQTTVNHLEQLQKKKNRSYKLPLNMVQVWTFV